MATESSPAVAPATDRDGIYVDNEWRRAGSNRRIEVVDPSYAETIGSVVEPDRDDVDAAVASSRRAFESEWSTLAPQERGRVMHAVADALDANAAELAELTTMEVGAPTAIAGFHAPTAAWFFRYYADMASSYPLRDDRRRPDGGVTRVLREPVGVVAAIAPWNGPVVVAGMKLAPALAAGCTAIMKSAPSTPLATYRMAEIMGEAGLPPGVVNVIAAEWEISEYLAGHPEVDKISFTGSTAVGRRLMELAAPRMKRLTLELGGKSAAIVGDDIPLEAVVPTLALGGCQNTGQNCIALTRVLVSEQRHDALVAAMKEAFEAMTVGDAHDPATEIGPLAMERQLDRVQGYIDLAGEEGATVASGGDRPPDLKRGFFIEPTLLTGVDNSMRIAQEEVFGPVVCVIPYRDLDDAVRIANDSIYGLNGSVYVGDEEQGYEIARRMRTGMVTVNSFITDFEAPFGGVKRSGQGREGGPEGLAGFLEFKSTQMLPKEGS